MTASGELLGTMQRWGAPVQGAVGLGPFIGRDGRGEPCLYAVFGQEAGDEGGLFVLQIDPATGSCRRFDAPVAAAGGRPAFWSDRHEMLFIGASPREHKERGEGGWLLALDPRREEIISLGVLHPGRSTPPVSIAEAADGSVYIASYGNCGLYRWQPTQPDIEFCGRADTVDHYGYVQCGADGSVAVLVKMSQPHVVAYDVVNGTFRTVGPTADTNTGQGHVELKRGEDGHLYIVSHEGCLRLEGAAGVPVDAPPASPAPRTLPDGSRARFIGRQPPRYVELVQPDGARRVLRLEYEAAGVEIYLVRSGPDGRIYGSSILPLHFFVHDPASGQSIDYGECSTSSGEIYSMDWLDGKLYLCAYTHAILCEYDPQRDYNFAFVREVDGELRETPGESDAAWPCRFRFGPDDNPRQLGRMDTVAFRPRDMVAGPAGKIWVTSMPDYGMWGGTLSWYDPQHDYFGGAHRDIVPHCSPQAITWIRDQNLLVLGFSIYGGSGTMPRTDRAGFALWNPETDSEVWQGDLGLHIVGVMDLEYSGDGLAYAIVHPHPPDVLLAELLLLDLRGQRIVARTELTACAGWPLEVSFQRDDNYLYGATRESIYRVPLGTVDIEVLWRANAEGSAAGAPTAGGALAGDDYYFASGAQLQSVRVR